VVSGLARGIDNAAHEGALAAGGITIGVAANGLDGFSVAGRESIVDRIVGTGGTIVSIAPPGGPPTRERLLLRNQFTSGLADVVLAVQSRGRGGTLATMRHACRQGKIIATVNPPLDSIAADWSGNAMLLASESPWNDRNLHWRPAIALSTPADLVELFAHFRNAPRVDAMPPVYETQKPVQPRLLEERASYDGDD
jgi:DNA processing protein